MGILRRTPRELRLLERANLHEGLLDLDDLADLGLTQSAIHARAEACRLNRVYDGVYAFGHTALTDKGQWLAALWTCGEQDVLSHFTAGAYHRWRIPYADDRIHLSTLAETRSRDDLRVHRVKTLTALDWFEEGEYRVTTVPRTLVDLADLLTWDAFRALADSLKVLDIELLRRAQERAPGRVGRGRVTRLIEADDAHTRSEFERRFLRFCRAHGLPRPDDLNVRVAGHEADCLYRSRRRLVIELDGRGYHERRSQMRADRRRDFDYQVKGCLILRLVWDDLHPDSAADTVERLTAMLAAAAA